MSATALKATVVAPSDETAAAAEIVEKFLVASMVPDPETAARYIAEPLKLTFTGGRKFSHPRESTAFNAKRYKWVKKAMERSDVVPGRGETIVYNIGTLYGEWPDGTPFEGNRYVDRFVVRGGKIVQMDVWNDSAERILTSRGIEAYAPALVLKPRSGRLEGWPGLRCRFRPWPGMPAFARASASINACACPPSAPRHRARARPSGRGSSAVVARPPKNRDLKDVLALYGEEPKAGRRIKH